MKKIHLQKRELLLPETWDDLDHKQRLYALDLLRKVYSKELTPELFRLYFLIRWTDYKPSRNNLKFCIQYIIYFLKLLIISIYYVFSVGFVRWRGYLSAWIILHRPVRNDRKIINYNLYRLSEQLNFAFSLKENSVIPNNSFAENPIPELIINGRTFIGRKFIRGIAPFTNITGKEFSDCFDIFTAYSCSKDQQYKDQCANKIISILYPAEDDYDNNLVSNHSSVIAKIEPCIRFGIMYWFTGIIEFYITHPIYSILFKSATVEENRSAKRDIGMTEVVLMVTKQGYNLNGKMNVNDFFDAQIKILKDMIADSLAKGATKDDIMRTTGLNISDINSLI